ncbi:MAG: hypothetical protein AAGH15_22215 [Myxococcota bacterium]
MNPALRLSQPLAADLETLREALAAGAFWGDDPRPFREQIPGTFIARALAGERWTLVVLTTAKGASGVTVEVLQTGFASVDERDGELARWEGRLARLRALSADGSER